MHDKYISDPCSILEKSQMLSYFARNDSLWRDFIVEKISKHQQFSCVGFFIYESYTLTTGKIIIDRKFNPVELYNVKILRGTMK